MDKQKQIEEMAVICCGSKTNCTKCFEEYKNVMGVKIKKRADHCQAYNYAERLYNAGYRKIPENAVVLTKEEYEKHKEFSREEVDEISETAIKNSRKNTAEKFAEMLKDEHSGIEQDKDGEHLVIVLDEEELDEICKKITEGE